MMRVVIGSGLVSLVSGLVWVVRQRSFGSKVFSAKNLQGSLCVNILGKPFTGKFPAKPRVLCLLVSASGYANKLDP